VEDGSAKTENLLPGFIVKTIDGQTPTDLKEIAKLLFDKKPGDKVQFGIFWQQRVNYSVRYGTRTIQITVR